MAIEMPLTIDHIMQLDTQFCWPYLQHEHFEMQFPRFGFGRVQLAKIKHI